MAKAGNAATYRTFGIDSVESVPWGAHLCQFYELKSDLIDILVPYFVAGLSSNEFCMWVTSSPWDVKEATETLAKAIPNLDKYLRIGQLEIVSYNDWYLADDVFNVENVLKGWVRKEENALKRGFEGLRFASNVSWMNCDVWQRFLDYESTLNKIINTHKMIVLCTYCLSNCSGADIIEAIGNHVGVLLKKGETWILVENDRSRRAAEILKAREQDYSSLFLNIMDGFAYYKMVLNSDGEPSDYVVLRVNEAFEQLTGLRRENILGKHATEVRTGIEDNSTDSIRIYGEVALTGEPVKFEKYARSLGKWFAVSAFCPQKGYFAVIFEDITQRKKSENSLSLNDERFRSALQNSPVIMGNLDRDLRFTWAYNLQSGYKAEDLIGKKFGTGMNFENMEELLENFRSAIAEGDLKRIEAKGSGPAGERVFDFYIEPKRNKNGEVLGTSFTSLNITDLRKAEEELRKSEQRWLTTVTSIGDAVITTNLAGHVTFMNSVAEVLTGWSSTDALNQPLKKVFNVANEKTRKEVESPVSQVLKKGAVIGLANHTVLLRKDGTEVPIDDSSAPIKDGEGKITGIVLVFHDITERRKVEDEVSRQAALIDLSPDAIIVRKLDGIITFWSEGAEKMYGWKKEETIGKNIYSILQTVLPQPLESIVVELKQSNHWSGEIIHTTKTGHKLTIQSYWRARFDKNGEVSEMLESNVDVTDRKQMQSKLEDYATHLEELVQERTKQLRDAERLTAIGETAGMVGHDLRNPLQTLTGEIFLVKNELNQLINSQIKQDLEESIDIIADQISYMDKIVSDLQDFVRPITVDKKQVDIQKLLTATLAQVAVPENVDAQIQIDEKLPEVPADSQLLKRVFFNLFTNALQAMPNGGKLNIKAYTTAFTKEENGKVVIQVEDTGTGIPENMRSKIFRPLFTTKSKGQGFGLAVCRRVIETHGGTITFESQEGNGTRFTVELPT